VISTITSTGLEVARKHFPQNLSFFYPIDMTFAVRRVLEAVRPSLIVLVELELWPTFLTIAKRSGVPIAVVNGRISERSYRRYKLVRRLITRPIRKFCVQNEEYARRFLGLGVEPSRVLITGNLKYDTTAVDAAADPAARAREIRAKLGIAPDAPVIVAGSTHPTEERACVEAWKRLSAEHPGLRLVVVPRHMERLNDVLKDIESAGAKPVRKTQLDSGTGTGTGTNDVIVVDTMGELSRIYLIADAVFVGGSLIPHGGQNMLEPAALGKAVLFGPHVRNFRAIAEDLIKAGGAEMVADAAALGTSLAKLLRDRDGARRMGERGREFVESHRGAAKRTVEVLKELLETPRPFRGGHVKELTSTSSAARI
jgi:3-deoxy-D-manno-octulosonic-acid transferase